MVVWLMVQLPNLERTYLDRAVLFCLTDSLRILSSPSPVDEGEQEKKDERSKIKKYSQQNEFIGCSSSISHFPV